MQEKINVGNVEIIALLDMIPPPRSPADFFPGPSASEWEKYEEDVLVDGMIQLYYGCFLVRSGRKIFWLIQELDRDHIQAGIIERAILCPTLAELVLMQER